MGYGAQLYRIWSAAERSNECYVRGRSKLARTRPVLADYRAPQSEHLLYRADGDQDFSEMGRALASKVRDEQPQVAWDRWRADQSRSVDVVSRGDRPRALSDSRHMVADGNRYDNDNSASWRNRDQTWFGYQAIPGRDPGGCKPPGRTGPSRNGRVPRYKETLAFDVQDDIQGPRQVRQAILVGDSGNLLHGRRSASRRRWILLG